MDKSKPLTIEEIHKETLGVLKKFISICDEIKVNYFVAYGSLIGAVRHQGFIPWDDDFDVFMLRPDYDKLVEYCNTNAEKLYPFKLMNKENTPGYPLNISRFNDLRFRMESTGYPDAGMGVFMDVYPLDGVGNGKKEVLEKYSFKKNLYMNLWGLKIVGKFQKSSKGIFRTIIKWLIYYFTFMIDYKYFLRKLDELKDIYNYEESQCVSLVVWESSMQAYDKTHFASYELLDFEGIKVKVPKDYEKLLKMVYGDYMELPPVERRIPTHNYLIFRK